MAFDGITIAGVVAELNSALTGGRISKISQPEKEEIVITVKNDGKQYKLFLSACASLPLIYLTDTAKAAPLTAPNFCMVLRKHLQSAKILSVTQPGMERVVEIRAEHLDEMGDMCQRILIFELMGKYSNLILCNDNQVILDSLKHVPSSMSSVREVLPGREYFIPVTCEKKNALETDKNEFFQLVKAGSLPVYKMLYQSFTGISPFIARELCDRANLDDRKGGTDLNEDELQALWEAFFALITQIKEKDFTPVVLYENGKEQEFAVTDISSFAPENRKAFESVSEMLAFFYHSKNNADVMRQKTLNLRKTVQTILERDYKKLDLQEKQLRDAAKKEQYKIYGELLNTYGYGVEEGAASATVLNYYTNEEITIPLDKEKSVKDNAKRYFEKYTKMKRTEEALGIQLEETKKEIAYLESVHTFLQIASSKEDLNQIRHELYERRYIRKKPDKQDKKNASKPLHYRTEDGYEIYVGKNNLQNEELTFRMATGNDWWFHAKGVPGSHVIVKAPHENPATEWDMPDEVFEAAAALAAMNSKNRDQEKVEVDYIRKKHVKRPGGGEPGFVVYYTNFSMVIETNIDRFALTLID